MAEESKAVKFAEIVGEAVKTAAKEGVDADTVAIALAYHIGNIMRYCKDDMISVQVLKAIQEISNEQGGSPTIVVEQSSSTEEMLGKIDAMKEKPKGDLH